MKLRRRFAVVALILALAVIAAGCDESDQFDLVNADRNGNGVPSLSYNFQLQTLARDHARAMADADSLYHSDLTSVLNSPGYSAFYTLGENILVGPAGMDVATMESAWMGSPGHRANILNRAFNQFGFGSYTVNGRVWAVQEFGGI